MHWAQVRIFEQICRYPGDHFGIEEQPGCVEHIGLLDGPLVIPEDEVRVDLFGFAAAISNRSQTFVSIGNLKQKMASPIPENDRIHLSGQATAVNGQVAWNARIQFSTIGQELVSSLENDYLDSAQCSQGFRSLKLERAPRELTHTCSQQADRFWPWEVRPVTIRRMAIGQLTSWSQTCYLVQICVDNIQRLVKEETFDRNSANVDDHDAFSTVTVESEWSWRCLLDIFHLKI